MLYTHEMWGFLGNQTWGKLIKNILKWLCNQKTKGENI